MLAALRTAFDKTIILIAIVLIVALLADVVLGIVSRLANDPFIWTDEVARMMMVWIAAMGWIVASRHRSHVRIRFFQDMLKGVSHEISELIIQAALIVLGVFVAIYSVDLTRRNLDMEATSVPVSMAWVYAPMVLVGVVTVAQALGECWAILMRMRQAPVLGDGVQS